MLSRYYITYPLLLLPLLCLWPYAFDRIILLSPRYKQLWNVKLQADSNKNPTEILHSTMNELLLLFNLLSLLPLMVKAKIKLAMSNKETMLFQWPFVRLRWISSTFSCTICLVHKSNIHNPHLCMFIWNVKIWS